MPEGKIKKLTDKGFGFIEGERGDIFFHSSSLVSVGFEELEEGQAVRYSEAWALKGNGPRTSKLSRNRG